MFDSFCSYRLPGEERIYLYTGNMKEGIHRGFVIAPFDLNMHPAKTIIGLSPAKWEDLDNILAKEEKCVTEFEMPHISTTAEEHKSSVETIIKELAGNPNKKTIAAKIICSNERIDVRLSFESMVESVPDAFVFMFYTPASGAWLGASPELLLKSDKHIISTYALAGTRRSYESRCWDLKNIKEHQIVKDYILNYFFKCGIIPDCSSTITKQAGSIEHLFCEFTAPLPKDIIQFIKGYSPTPALCGMPKEESLERISRIENFQRGYYGGFCGPFESTESFSLYVILRSMRFDKSGYCFYSGGGITSLSDAKLEWQETERKAQSILSLIKFSNN